MTIQHFERSRWLLLAIALLVLIGLQQFAELPFHNAFGESLSNSMHIAMFAGLTQLVYWTQPAIRFWLIATVVFVIALTTEALQYFTGGKPSVDDLLRDGLGFAIAAAIHYRRLSGTRKIAALVIVTSLVTLAAPGVYLYAGHTKSQDFPMIFQPDVWPQSLYVDLRNVGTITESHTWPQYADQPVVELLFHTGRWRGIHIAEPYEDWRAYEYLIVDTFNPGLKPITLNLSLRHKPDTGIPFYKSRQLGPGFNQLRLPLADMAYLEDGSPAAIGQIVIYSQREIPGERIWLGKIWLE